MIAGWLLFLWFPFVAAAVALIRQRELEREVLSGTRSRPSGAWFAILAVPMAASRWWRCWSRVAFGPAAPAIGRGVAAGPARSAPVIDGAGPLAEPA